MTIIEKQKMIAVLAQDRLYDVLLNNKTSNSELESLAYTSEPSYRMLLGMLEINEENEVNDNVS